MHSTETDRVKPTARSNAVEGKVVWLPAKSIWISSMTIIALIGAPLTFSYSALALFLITAAITICAGHSVGMHRMFIHKAFDAPLWLRRLLVYLGTLVGMGGPFGVMTIHEIRDWAQQQTDCHDFFAHRKGFLHDSFWQMHCNIKLHNPPELIIEAEVLNDPFFRFLERTWMLQQLPWAILFFYFGGWSWVIWGICLRVAASLTGHWLVVHFSHQGGHQGWAVEGVAVQGYNLRNLSLITFGESLHGNHHAFPRSARLGLEDGQLDPGWWLIKTLRFLGLVENVMEPAEVGEREGLRRVVQG
jgi:sn-1 stearoyl-lipid 9-desaturase